MNRVILCEGKTDSIFLGYYLGAVCGWTWCKKPKRISFQINDKQVNSEWYHKDGEYLLIIGVGGNNRFEKTIKDYVVQAVVASGMFKKIAVVVDRDDMTDEYYCDMFNRCFTEICNNVSLGAWFDVEYINGFGQIDKVELLLQVLPRDKEGAIETVMLDAISENGYDKFIVNASREFVDKMSIYAEKYISKQRLKLKAELSVVWAIQSPQKVFEHIDDLIKSVSWENYEFLANVFSEIVKI